MPLSESNFLRFVEMDRNLSTLTKWLACRRASVSYWNIQTTNIVTWWELTLCTLPTEINGVSIWHKRISLPPEQGTIPGRAT